ncbi:cobaltochelatase CobN [Thermoanaerobacter kivui]|uniref:Cobaltochelatase CobN n=1 Tax=Thermoanaerobacter kivui TaxID=2325 RepID=A0A097ASK7_THEKI|nr:cobaltochelatase subunit CobN [Thermoanaerobacter kivui]AIS52811.1 cobaltochelatase CobN [Thermoanaerobacter kivui]
MATKILFYTAIDTELINVSNAVRNIYSKYGPIVNMAARSKRDVEGLKKEEELIELALSSDMIIIHLMGGTDSLPAVDKISKLSKEKGIGIAVLPCSGEDYQELYKMSTLSEKEYFTVYRYISYGGISNFENLFLWISNRFSKTSFSVIEPEPLPWEGIYHPDYSDKIEAKSFIQERLKEKKPVIGIIFYQSYWNAGNIEFINDLIREIENLGGTSIPVFLNTSKNDGFGSKGIEWVIDNYFMQNGIAVVDAVINTLMFSQTVATPTFSRVLEGNFYKRLGKPIIKAILALTPFKDWKEGVQGLGPLDVVMSMALPEFDGDIITVPIATREELERDPLTGAVVTKYVPIKDRIKKVASLSLNWAKLKYKPNCDKKVAIIFHNYPPRNDRIGCAFGLDSPVSVHKLLTEMKNKGYKIENLPESGKELMERMLSGLTNERGWLSPEEMNKRAVGKVHNKEYETWYSNFPLVSQQQLEKSWGKPPGEIFSCGEHLLIPGILLGNVFIGVQPTRGFFEDPASIYHSPDLPPPHHYLAYYRWIRDVFKADIVYHIGKHGSLEWLPGKGNGLSEECYPDLVLMDLPNVYPYIINNPGEGTQAKRRSHACIIDHLIPVMTRADTYEEMADVEVLIKEYNEAKNMDSGKLPILRSLIWEKVEDLKLDSDLKITKEEAEKDWEEFLEKIHSYLYEIKDCLIRDGLHILGQPPEGEQLIEMILALTRLSNGEVPSLREALAETLGYNYEELIKNPGFYSVELSCTYAEVLDMIEEKSKMLVKTFCEEGFEREKIKDISMNILGKNTEKLTKILEFISEKVVPALKGTTQEIENCIKALEGNFVPPGPSGAPTRGMVDILPTGRNFYSIDPQAVPTRSSWKIGVELANSLLQKHKEETNSYPEMVGIVVWCTSNMRTGGDDIAEALYLMGVKPIWDEKSGRVKGLSVIPLEELGRPRIDVTFRVSGMFRDAMLNVIHLLDKAVEMVASLDEPDDMNYISKHVREEIKEKVSKGVNPVKAREEALWRIFSDKPGTYGAGVSDLVTSKNWKDEKDLCNVYVTWGGYVYSRNTYGLEAADVFSRRLASIDATVKNEDSREIDMFDSDDFYSYHGGMVAAVKALKGSLPHSYSGDTSDPERVKVRTLEEETRRIFRARILNPKWIESMKRHGYKGAGDLSHMVETAFGWDATAEVLDDWLYEELAKKYALNEDMQQWFKEENPWALKNIVENLLEAIQRDMWQPSEELKNKLREIYLDIEGKLEEYT